MKRVFCLPGLFYPVLHFVHLCRCVYVSIHHSSASEIPQVLISSVLFCFCFFNLDICLAKTLSFQLCLKKKLGCFYNTSFSLSFFLQLGGEAVCCSCTGVFTLLYIPPSVKVSWGGGDRRCPTASLNLHVTYHQLLFDKFKQSNSIMKCHPPGSWCVLKGSKKTAISRDSFLWSSKQQFYGADEVVSSRIPLTSQKRR